MATAAEAISSSELFSQQPKTMTSEQLFGGHTSQKKPGVDVEGLVKKYFPENVVGTFVRIAQAESSNRAYITNAGNKNKTKDHGLFQVNDVHKKELIDANVIQNTDDLYDPETNTKAAAWLYKKYGTQPWNASKNEWGKESPYEEPSFRSSPPENIAQKTWDKVKDIFGEDWNKERARASNALVYSEMLNIRPSQAYKYADEISAQMQHNLDGEKIITESKGYGKAFTEGFDNSIFGMMSRQKTIEPFESVDQMERWINTFTTMATDSPFYLAGYLMGGAGVTGVGGSFGFTEGVRRILIDRYNKGKVQSFEDLMGRLKNAGLDAVKGEVTGMATAEVGALTPYGTKALMQLATITTTGKLLEGQVPTAKDFKDNAVVLTAMMLGIKNAETAKGALQEVYAKTGKAPTEVIDTLKKAAPLTGEEQELKLGLKPALKIGGQIVTGEEGETHQDIIEKTGIEERPKIKTVRPREIKSFDKEYEDYLEGLKNEGIDEGTIREAERTAQSEAQAELEAEGYSTEDIKALTGEVGEEPERGFTSPEGEFFNREKAEKWVEENEPEAHETWKGIAGEESEFHSEDYNQAKEITSKGNQLLNMMADETGAVSFDPAIRLARQYLEKVKEGKKASKYGHALRTFFVGLRDSRIAETNQLRDEIASLIPDYKDQEALSLLRDFKNKPDELKVRREKYKTSDKTDLKKIIPIIDRALNPSSELLEADRKMTDYFESRLNEGKKLGFLDSNISNDEYITHLLEPEEMTEGIKGLAGGKIGRRFQFAKSRTYPTILDALEKEGIKVKTFNALDAMTIYGDKHATVAATKLLIDELKTTNMGKWGFKDADNIPNDWVEIAPGRELFRNRIAVLDKETGEPRTITQNLFVPKVVQEALAPIIDPASIANVPGFRSGRLYQAWIKSVELGLSVFHMKALNITALNNEKLTSLIKSYRSDLASKEFKDEEIEFIKSGGTTSVLGRTIEAYKAAKPSSFPTRMDIIRNVWGVKQLDALAESLTHETFDVMQRKFKVMDYSLKKAAWIAKHPNDPLDSFTEARSSIAKEINAAYGGLQWEVLGVNKNTLEITKAIMLAPDWTFSNVFNLKYAFEGAPAGQAARKFWIKSAITGILLTEGTSILLTGQGSKHPTEVYMGKDKDGKEIYTNMYFAGAPKDFVSWLTNIKNYGAVEGTAHSIAQKLGPLARTGMDVLTNKDWMGQPIVRREEPFLTKTAKGAGFIAEQLAPIPFSITNIGRMMMDDKIDYEMKDFIAQLGGSPPRHEAPYADTKTRMRKRYQIRSWGH